MSDVLIVAIAGTIVACVFLLWIGSDDKKRTDENGNDIWYI